MKAARPARFFWLIALLFLTASCSNAPAAVEPTALPPTAIPQPTAIPPTATTVPTETAVPTSTPKPGPVSIKDDFSSRDAGLWPAECFRCDWSGGALVLGPYRPGTNPENSMNYIICEGCGAHSYFRVAVDATFMDGQVDRYFGLIAPLFRREDGTASRLYYMGLSPWQFMTIRDYDLTRDLIKNVVTKSSGAVRAGKLTNRLEIIVKPAEQNGMVDLFFNMNGQTVGVVYSQPASAAWAALGMSFHGTTVAYDNFEYEELIP